MHGHGSILCKRPPGQMQTPLLGDAYSSLSCPSWRGFLEADGEASQTISEHGALGQRFQVFSVAGEVGLLRLEDSSFKRTNGCGKGMGGPRAFFEYPMKGRKCRKTNRV